MGEDRLEEIAAVVDALVAGELVEGVVLGEAAHEQDRDVGAQLAEWAR